jgi:Rap1a immunity proteins
MKTVFLTLFAVMLIPHHIYASDSSGQMNVGDLQRICTSDDKESKSACSFYILGASEGVSLGAGNTGTKRICIDNVPGTKLEFVVKKLIGEDLMFYPKDRDLAAVSFVSASLQKTFPCKSAK